MLPRLLSRWGLASRREAEEWVSAGRVQVDDRVVRDVLRVVRGTERILVDGRLVGPRATTPRWLALNKPRGVVTTTRDEAGRRTVMDLLGTGGSPSLAPVGRLDRASAGLLLLSDDHVLAARLLSPEGHVQKRYRVKVRGEVGDVVLGHLREDVVLEDGLRMEPLDVVIERVTERGAWLVIHLREGKNRQIRRQLARQGLAVEVLLRLSFGPIELGDLPPGAWRELTPSEVAALRAAPAEGRGPSAPRPV
jgi:23S rRNA pseudouridine2605 synthase